MTRPDRRNAAWYAGAVLIVVVLGIVVPIAATLISQASDCRRYYSTPQKEPGEANCPPIASPPPQREPAPERREWREESDLAAQQEMARWAFWMVLVSAAGVFVSGVAVLLVRETLDAARKANEGFARASQQQLTAYVLTEGFEVTQQFDELPTSRFSVFVSFKIRNAGQTPAFDVMNHVRCDWATYAEVEAWDLNHENASRGVFGPGRAVPLRLPILGVHTSADIAQRTVAQADFWVRGACVYRDINNRWWRHDYCLVVASSRDFMKAREPSEKARTIRSLTHNAGNSLTLIEAPTPV